MRKIEISIALAGIGVALAAWLFPISASQQSSPTGSSGASPATLLISGTGANVKVRKGPNGTTYVSSEISSAGSDSVIYLPLGQALKLEVSGTGAEVLIEAALMPQIQVISTATGASVSAF